MMKSLNRYEESLKTHPGLITGFDLVHYEDLILLEEVLDDLLLAKERNPKINFVFHAGETLNK